MKESVLLRLDLVCAHEEIAPRLEKLKAALGVSLPVLPTPDAFLDWLGHDCPDRVDDFHAVPRKVLSDAVEAWSNGRGQKARKNARAPKKMDAVVTLLAAVGIASSPGALAVLWSQLRKAGRATWRDDEWFRGLGAKAAASS